jgi:hypothetical protein
MFEKSKLLLILTCLIGILFPLDSNAQSSSSGDSGGKITVHAIIVGVLLILTGIIFCFFGRRIYRLTLFLIGFYIGTIIGWVVLNNAGVDNNTIILLVSLAIGLVVGLLFLCCSTVAIWFLGALTGYLLALFILAWASDGVIHSRPGRIILIVILTIVGFLFACLNKNAFIILGTAFIGAYAIILGIDLFVRTGFAESVSAFTDGNHDVTYETNIKVYLMLAGMVALFIVGSLFQFKYHKDHFGPAVGPGPTTGEKRHFWERRRRHNAV